VDRQRFGVLVLSPGAVEQPSCGQKDRGEQYPGQSSQQKPSHSPIRRQPGRTLEFRPQCRQRHYDAAVIYGGNA
jgi:hypothetical protein